MAPTSIVWNYFEIGRILNFADAIYVRLYYQKGKTAKTFTTSKIISHLKKNHQEFINGSFHVKCPGPSSLTQSKFAQNMSKCCIS